MVKQYTHAWSSRLSLEVDTLYCVGRQRTELELTPVLMDLC